MNQPGPGPAPGCPPAGAQLAGPQDRVQRAARGPPGLPGPVRQAGQGDGPSGRAARLVRGGPQPDQQPGPLEQGEELRLGPGRPGGPQRLAGQHGPGGRVAHAPPGQARPGPPAPQLGQGEVGGELPAAEPDRAAVRAVVQGDGVAGDLAGPDRGMPQADQDAAGLKGGEELLLGPGGRRGGPDVPVQDGAVRLAAGPGGPFHLGAGQRLRGGPVRPGQHAQPVLALDVAQRLAEPVKVVLRPHGAPVLAGEGGDDVDVAVAVVDRYPAHAPVLAAALGQAGAVHDLGGDRVPRAVAEAGVLGRGPDRQVVDELAGHLAPGELHGQLEQRGQAVEVAAAVGPAGRFQAGRVDPPGDQVRVDVLVLLALAVQVVQDAAHVLPARQHPADHRRSSRAVFSVAASIRRTARATAAAEFQATSPQTVARRMSDG